jgi:predicted ATPase
MTANPPRYAQPLLGRGAALDGVLRLLRTPGRVVSVVGPGGIGKTRLVAAALERSPGLFVSLGSVGEVSEVPGAVAEALGLEGIDDAAEAVIAALEPGVVVLDEVEHLHGVEPLIARWVAACPRVSWLVTSRRPLDIDAEVTIELLPLEVPDAACLATSDAANLLRNAAPVRLDLEADTDAIAAVLRLTAGVPLAIELAAARLALLPVEALRKRIDARYFATLRDPARPERGLEVVLEDTWRQLQPAERHSLAEATVFAAPFRVEDAEAVLGAGADVLDHLQTLHRWHLVHSDDGWIRLLEPVRRFAAARLDPKDERDALRRHAAWVGSRTGSLVGELSQRPKALLGELRLLAPELHVVLARAERQAVDVDNAVIAGLGLVDLYTHRGPMDRALAVAERALALGEVEGDAAYEARASLQMLYAQRLSSEGHPGALEAARTALDMVDGARPVQLGNVYNQLGSVLHLEGDLVGARRALERAMALSEGTNAWVWGAADLALVAHDEGEHAAAAELLDRAVIRARERSQPLGAMRVLEVGATIAVERRKVEDGERWNRLFLASAIEVGDERKIALSGVYDGVLAEIRGDLVAAKRAYVAARGRLVESASSRLVALADGLLGRVALTEGELGRARELLPQWRLAWTQTGSEADVYAAVLAALTADPERAAGHADAVPAAKLAQLARQVAQALVAPVTELVDPGRLADLRATASDITDPIDRRLGERMVQVAEARGAGWVVAADGTWARAPTGERLDLSRSRATAAILAALAAAHAEDAGPLDVAALASAGWPGTRLVQKSAQSRVYVALSSLRKAGFEELIQRGTDGWSFDGEAAVYVEGRAPGTRVRPAER